MEGEGASFPRPYFRCKHKCLFPHIRSHPLHTIKIQSLAALSQQPPIMRESGGTGAYGRYSKTLFLRRILDRGLRLNLSLISPHLQTSPPHTVPTVCTFCAISISFPVRPFFSGTTACHAQRAKEKAIPCFPPSLPAESADALWGLVVYCTHIGRMGREGGGYGTSNVEGR